MGVDAADINGDGWEDLFVANVNQEMFSLYTNNKNETFSDAAHKHGVAQATRLLSGWGLKFFDYDNDGAVDLILANGHPDDMIEIKLRTGEIQGALAAFPPGARAAAQCQLGRRPGFLEDRWPRVDWPSAITITTASWMCWLAPTAALRCCCTIAADRRGNHWLGVKLEGMNCNRDAIGARLTWSAGGVNRTQAQK